MIYFYNSKAEFFKNNIFRERKIQTFSKYFGRKQSEKRKHSFGQKAFATICKCLLSFLTN